MRIIKIISIWIFILLFTQTNFSQMNRIKYNNQDLFLSGANLAWLSFAQDIGAGKTDHNSFADILLKIHDNGGNALRWWLHTDGTATPEFNGSDHVVGPGQGTISDMKKVLDLAWEREVGVVLCLWSFDMLRSNKGTAVLNRNTLLLTDTTYTKEYINNCLIPMVDSLKGHPAIIAWEIFNEPEGMSNEFGWSDIKHVPMSAIQRFVNLCSGAIHRIDPNALVTNGTWGFLALTDVSAKVLGKIGADLSQMSIADKMEMEEVFYSKYRIRLTADEIIQHFQKAASAANMNYYSDSRLIAAGGDPDGILDFYSVHYYSWAGDLSPFARQASFWALTKPIVVAEFHMTTNNGVPKENLFPVLYLNGYAGALPWSWTDNQVTKVNDMLNGMKYMWDIYRHDVDVNGIGGDWPVVSIINPKNDTQFPENPQVTIEATASDSDGSVILVEFFANDTIKIGKVTTEPYSVVWTNVKAGDYKLSAVATDNEGHKRTSTIVKIVVGTPPLTKLEAEAARIQGPGMSVGTDPTASNHAYVNIATNDTTAKITWTLNNVPAAGKYEIAFGYKLFYNTPKSQFINVNGIRVAELEFTAASLTTWYEKTLNVDLIQGQNTIQMQMSWGWMYVDYLAVSTSKETLVDLPGNYSLMQNYPNPFNPTTIISYQIPKAGHVSLKVYDLLGREVTTLVHEEKAAGRYKIEFNTGHLSNQNQLASGIYFYRLIAGDFIEIKKMVLIK